MYRVFLGKKADNQMMNISLFLQCLKSLFPLTEKPMTASVVEWSEFVATDPEVLGSIPGTSRSSEKQRVWNGVHSAL
jgi:hypothetical protein